jgi:TPR repeat protein
MRRLSSAVLLLSLQIPPTIAGEVGATAYARGDYTTAYTEWLQAGEDGDPSAMEAVGMLYDTGQGVQQSFFLAMLWYNRAANAGNVSAMFDLAAMYDNGRGIPRDRLSAIKWYEMAAQRGNARAAYNLGVIYRDGDGVPRNIASSIEYFKIAARHGIAAAKQNLAYLDRPKPKSEFANTLPSLATKPSRDAPTPPSDNNTAVMVIRPNDNMERFRDIALDRSTMDASAAKAFIDTLPVVRKDAATGNELAEYYLGYAYEHGIGVPRDIEKSYIYYLKSSSSNDEKVILAAIHGGVDVGLQLTSDQLKSAGDLVFGKNLTSHKGEVR